MSRKRPDRFQDLVGASPWRFNSLLENFSLTSYNIRRYQGERGISFSLPSRRFSGES